MSTEVYRNDTLHIKFPRNKNHTTSDFMKMINPFTSELENDYDIVKITNVYANIRFSLDEEATAFKERFEDNEEGYEIDYFKEKKDTNNKIHISHIPVEITLNKFLELLSNIYDKDKVTYQFNSDSKCIDFTFGSSDEAAAFKLQASEILAESEGCSEIRVKFFRNLKRNNRNFQRSERYTPYDKSSSRGRGRSQRRGRGARYEEDRGPRYEEEGPRRR